MQISGWKRAVLGITATVILGALGSGLWEIAVRPGGYWFWHSILTAVTFGSKFLKDQVYLEAAKGNHEASSQFSISILGGFIGVLLGLILGMVVGKKVRRNDASEKRFSFIAPSPKWLGYMEWFMLFSSLFLFGIFSAGQLRLNTANEAYTYFRQSLEICRPYMADHQTRLLESRFAALRTRDEYIGIANDMKQVAAANHLKLPDFHPW